MLFIKGSGLRLRDNYLPTRIGGDDVVVISEEVLPAGPSMGKRAGNLSLVVGMSEILSEYNVPNPVDFVAGLVGRHTKNESLVQKFDSQFRTLGNGNFELNDILAFPVNWGLNVTEFISKKLGGAGQGPKYNAPGYSEFVQSGRPGVFTERKSSNGNNNNGNNSNNNTNNNNSNSSNNSNGTSQAR